nr:D-alanyl-D-alanine carboxypeptidase [Muribaculaceae bacterium]
MEKNHHDIAPGSLRRLPRRLTLLAAGALFCGVAALAQGLTFSTRSAAQVGIVVRDLATGRETVSVNPDAALTPASITKCVTAASVFVSGLADNRFDTPAYISGSVDGGVLNGSVVVRGTGDPTTALPSFPRGPGLADSIASALLRMGVGRVTGSIIPDCADLPAQGPNTRWEICDTEWSYGAGLFAINYNGNTRGTDLALQDPPEAFAAEVESALGRRGISVEWGDDELPPSESLIPLTSHKSACFEEILTRMMVRSDNLFAEAMLRALAPGSTLKASLAREKTLLQQVGLDTSCVGLYDGSGLSRNNRFSPRFLARLLAKMAARPDGARYTALFPLAGRDGTVKPLLRGTRLEGKLALKSGSMMGVLCYAGYKLGPDNRPTHAVVIM